MVKQSLIASGVASLILAASAFAAGQADIADDRMSVVYQGERVFLTDKLDSQELLELFSGNTLIFIHPAGLEVEYHQENGQTFNGWAEQESAKSGLWQVQEDEVCWTYNTGTHCKPMYATEVENLYAQVPGWYDGPLAAIHELGDSRNIAQRPQQGDGV